MGSFPFRAAVFAAAFACVPAFVGADEPPDSSRVGALAIPEDEAHGFVAFPEGDVFGTLIADPKAVKSFASYVRGTSASAFGTDLAPEGVATRLAHAGVELRPLAPFLRLGRNAGLTFVAGGDARATSALDWHPGLSARAGFEIANSPEAGHVTRRWAVLGEYYDGPSPYGQFFRSDVTYYGVGLHFSP